MSDNTINTIVRLVRGDPRWDEYASRPDVFVTMSGYVVPLAPISLPAFMQSQGNIAKAFREQGKPIDPPTYSVTTVAGDVEEHDLNEKNLDTAKNKDGTPNEEEIKRRLDAWNAHKETLAEMARETGRVSREILLEGIMLDLPEDDSWVKKLEGRYITVPKDRDDRWLFWLESIVFRSVGEFTECTIKIFKLSAQGMVSDEEVESLVKLFRRSILRGSNQPGQQVDAVEAVVEEFTSRGKEQVAL